MLDATSKSLEMKEKIFALKAEERQKTMRKRTKDGKKQIEEWKEMIDLMQTLVKRFE